MRKSIQSLLLALPVAILPLLLGPVPPTYANETNQIPRYEPADCLFNIPSGETIECGYLTVPENYAQPNGRSIRIFVAVVKSHSPTPAPDPIIYLRGGRGSPTKDFIERQLGQIDAWLAKRDVVLFDQRGLGLSQPTLTCPEVHESLLQERLGKNPTLEAQIAVRLTCRDRWLDEGIDLAAYNYFATAEDVADLWQALGYEQVNLIGASIWTVVGQLLVRDYGDTGHIRSAVLDSPVPLTVPAMADTPAQLAVTMRRLFAECEADLLCRAAYPNLESVYLGVIERLATPPVMVSATNPLDGAPFTFPFGVDDFGFFMQYGQYRKFPALIYDIYDGDYTVIAEDREQWLREAKNKNAGEHFGLTTTQNCNEPWNTISPEQQVAMARYPEAVFMDNPLDTALCKQWPAFDPGDQTLATGDTPTLVFTGEYDTRLPPAYGEMIVDALSNGYYFYVPGASHVVLASGGPCPNLMTLSFFDNPTQPPDECLASAGPPAFDTQFVIRAAAVRWPVQLALGAMSILLIGIVVGNGLRMRNYQTYGLRYGFAWQSTFRLVGWLPLVGSAVLIWFAIYGAQTRLLPINPTNAIALVLPLIIAIQAAFLFSPEDEPALEVILVTARPPALILLERLATLVVLQGAVGLLMSLYLMVVTGQALSTVMSSWLPLVFFLSSIAVYITLATRRAIMGVLVVCLLWFAFTFFGNSIVTRWPVAWPFHLYLRPSEAEYLLNRLFLALLGVSLLSITLTGLLANTERLLLGPQKSKRVVKMNTDARAVENSSVEFIGGPVHSSGMIVAQLLAMIRYEFLLQWRRNTLPALIVGLIVTPVIGAVVALNDFRGYNAALAAGTLSFDVARSEITAAMIPILSLGTFLIGIIMVPLFVADAIPKDQQRGVRELLDALPLSPATYLAGKIFSIWLSLLAGLVVAALISGVVWRLMVGPFAIDLFLSLWFVGGLLFVLVNSGTSILLAVGQPTNRWAILVGGAYVLLCLAGLGFIFSVDIGWWRWFNPARPAVMLYYLLGFPGALEGSDDWTRAGLEFLQQAANFNDVLLSLGAGLVQVSLLWFVAWQWMKRRKI